MKRRDLLKDGLAAGVSGILGGCATAQAAGGAFPGTRRPRNLIFLAYDGTGYEDAAAAGYFSRRILNRPLVYERLLSQGRTGSMQTHSLTSVVTDSAAGSSAWSTGRKVVNYFVSMIPDGTPLATIHQLARDRGMRTGLVTTTRITHATPAAFAVSIRNRDLEDEIAALYLENRIDVLLGGGAGHFDPAAREDRRDLFGDFRREGYDVVRTAEELERSNGSRILGAFTPGTEHMPYEIDRRFQGHPAPSLPAMTRKALDVLSGSDQPFILQVEVGRTDHANHYTDPGGLIWDWMAADETLQLILDFVDRDGETLLVVGSDHDTGGSVVYGFGPYYLRSTQAFETLNGVRASHEWLMNHGLSRQPTAEEVMAAVPRYLGYTVTELQAEQLARVIGTRPLPREARHAHPNWHTNHPDNSVGWILSQSRPGVPDRPNIAFATGQHTAGMVPVALYGPMVPQGSLGVIDNTALFGVMTEALGIRHENPTMGEEEAVRRIASMPLPRSAELHHG